MPTCCVLFVRQLGIGLVVGAAVGCSGSRRSAARSSPPPASIPVASLAIAALAFGGADVLHGSGFLAVYLAGLALGSAAIPAQRTIAAFHDGVAWVAQVAMFLTLGLLVFPSQLRRGRGRGHGARARRWRSSHGRWRSGRHGVREFGERERVVLGWAGLRGAVPVVLATFPVIADVPGSRELFNIVFFAVLVSTVLQGTTFEALARRFGVDHQRAGAAAPAGRGGTIRRLGAEMLEYPVADDDAIVGHRVRDLGLPRDAVRQRDRARRRGDPAARDDAPASGRPPARPGPPGERARALRHPRPLAHRPDRAAAAAAAGAAGPRAGLLRRRLARQDGDAVAS